MSKKPTVLMILDGFGLNEKTEGNAVAQAKTPVIDGLMKDYPFVKGNASGLAVGLPDGQMGNSEVGHLNMGAARIVYQELTRITKEISDGDFFKNQALLDGMENVKKNGSDLHLYGLLSNGGVHSHITHLFGLLEMAKKEGVENVYVHCFLDGRDTAPTSGKEFIEELEAKMKEIGVGKIASISGRYYAMDRDNRWDRVEKAYKVLTTGEGEAAESAVAAMDACAELESILKNDLKSYIANNANNINTDAVLNPVVMQYVDAVVVPTYKSLKEKNDALYNAVIALADNPSNSAFDKACEAWITAREPWEKSEAFLFGPVDEMGLDPNMDSWPLDQNAIVQILNSQSWSDLEWNENDDEAAVESAQNVRGFHTLEFLLYKNGEPRKVQ